MNNVIRLSACYDRIMGKRLKGESERNTDVLFEFMVIGPALGGGLDVWVCDHFLIVQNVLIDFSDLVKMISGHRISNCI